MSVAQKLYENGHITYMRTDSTNLSTMALDQIQSYIANKYGKNYAHPTQYASKSKNAQEAHEAIRPTDITIQDITL
jgi:DNA topoisomerase-1